MISCLIAVGENWQQVHGNGADHSWCGVGGGELFGSETVYYAVNFGYRLFQQTNFWLGLGKLCLVAQKESLKC